MVWKLLSRQSFNITIHTHTRINQKICTFRWLFSNWYDHTHYSTVHRPYYNANKLFQIERIKLARFGVATALTLQTHNTCLFSHDKETDFQVFLHYEALTLLMLHTTKYVMLQKLRYRIYKIFLQVVLIKVNLWATPWIATDQLDYIT